MSDIIPEASDRFPAGLGTDQALWELYSRVVRIEEALSTGGHLTIAAADQSAYEAQVAEMEAQVAKADAEAQAQVAQAQVARDRLAELARQRGPSAGATPLPTDLPGSAVVTPGPVPAMPPTPDPVTAGTPAGVPTTPGVPTVGTPTIPGTPSGFPPVSPAPPVAPGSPAPADSF